MCACHGLLICDVGSTLTGSILLWHSWMRWLVGSIVGANIRWVDSDVNFLCHVLEVQKPTK